MYVNAAAAKIKIADAEVLLETSSMQFQFLNYQMKNS